MGIFKKREEDPHGPAASTSMLPTWERLYQHELEQSMQHPPSNAFVEMIQWTNQGKLWTFPIDNEAGIVISTLTSCKLSSYTNYSREQPLHKISSRFSVLATYIMSLFLEDLLLSIRVMLTRKLPHLLN